MFDGRFRTALDKGVRPIGAGIRRTGVTADHLTALGLLMAVACAVTIASGRLFIGFVLLVTTALPDLFDGAVAKASGTASQRGAFFDSVSDRVSDSLVLGGLAWYLASSRGAHAAMLPFALLAVSALVSYERAKGELLGFDAKGGLMERAERVIALSFGLVFSALLVPVLWVMLALTTATAVQRFVKVWRQASAVRPRPTPTVAAPRTSAVMRWRAWRTRTGRMSSRARSSRRGVGPGVSRWQTRRAERLGTPRPRTTPRRRGTGERRSWRRSDS